jgi:hypothetical protein
MSNVSRREDPAYANWYYVIKEETDPERYNARNVTESHAELLRRRRRIEDVEEGLRLEREIFREVWDE